jgi:hypothetical protein
MKSTLLYLLLFLTHALASLQEPPFSRTVPRQLYNETTESYLCKTCIDQGNVYCPTRDLTQGYCCEPGESYCPSAGVCSNDFLNQIVAYQLCPSDEQACVYPRTIVPPNSATIYHQYTRYF